MFVGKHDDIHFSSGFLGSYVEEKLTACRNVNCRTHENRHCERMLRPHGLVQQLALFFEVQLSDQSSY